MKCILLQAPGETMEGLMEMKKLGFDCQAYPVSQEVHLLRDTHFEEFTDFLGNIPGWCDKPYARSLRISFAKMLLDPAFAEDNLIIFGESDATPIIQADKLRTALEQEMEDHPETDVFRLFHDLATSPALPPSLPLHPGFEPYMAGQHSRNEPYVWGTHALIIPARSRQKVADLFLNWRIPTDTSLEVAQSRGLLNIRVAKHNLFYQKPRTSKADVTRLFSWRKRRLALCLSSYKRPEDLQRQIFAMMNQSYDKDSFHLFVALKGIPEFYANSFIIPQFCNFMEDGRLSIRCFPNRNQLSNLLDCTRNLDTSRFDLFLKIDDDDFYCRDYLKTINEFHSLIPQHYSSFFSDWSWALYKHHGIVSPQLEPFYVFGSSMAVSPQVWQRLYEAEADPSIIRDTMARHCGGKGHSCIAYSEDNFIHQAMCDFGCANIAPFVKQKGLSHYLMVQKSNASVTRGGLVPGDAAAHVDLAEPSPPQECVIYAFHTDWKDSLRIYGPDCLRVSNGDRARVLEFSDKRLVLRWEKWGTERFEKDARGAYVHVR